jgi:hypothetical protein
MFKTRSYATELDTEGFRVYDAMGCLVHDVRWTNVEHLTVFHGNGMGGPGTLMLLAGEEFDGALPDPYLGIERMLDLFKRHADSAALSAVDQRL